MDEKAHRGTPRGEAPFCWQSKAARDAIRTHLDGTDYISAALSIYDALCEIESDSAGRLDPAGAFETTHAYIAMKAGVSAATVKRRMPELEALGLVATAPHAGPKGPKKYRLLSCARPVAIAHNDPSIGHAGNRGTRPPSEEQRKKTKEPRSRANSAHAPAPLPPVPAELGASATFMEAWGRWTSYWPQMARRSHLPAEAAENHLLLLEQLGAGRATLAIENAISKGLKKPCLPPGTDVSPAGSGRATW